MVLMWSNVIGVVLGYMTDSVVCCLFEWEIVLEVLCFGRR